MKIQAIEFLVSSLYISFPCNRSLTRFTWAVEASTNSDQIWPLMASATPPRFRPFRPLLLWAEKVAGNGKHRKMWWVLGVPSWWKRTATAVFLGEMEDEHDVFLVFLAGNVFSSTPLCHLKMWMCWTDQNRRFSRKTNQNRVSCGFLSIDANYHRYTCWSQLSRTEILWQTRTSHTKWRRMQWLCVFYTDPIS